MWRGALPWEARGGRTVHVCTAVHTKVEVPRPSQVGLSVPQARAKENGWAISFRLGRDQPGKPGQGAPIQGVPGTKWIQQCLGHCHCRQTIEVPVHTVHTVSTYLHKVLTPHAVDNAATELRTAFLRRAGNRGPTEVSQSSPPAPRCHCRAGRHGGQRVPCWTANETAGPCDDAILAGNCKFAAAKLNPHVGRHPDGCEMRNVNVRNLGLIDPGLLPRPGPIHQSHCL